MSYKCWPNIEAMSEPTLAFQTKLRWATFIFQRRGTVHCANIGPTYLEWDFPQ